MNKTRVGAVLGYIGFALVIGFGTFSVVGVCVFSNFYFILWAMFGFVIGIPFVFVGEDMIKSGGTNEANQMAHVVKH